MLAPGAPRPGIPGGVDFIRNLKRGQGPADIGAGGLHLISPQGAAVGGGGALLVGRTPTDHRLTADQAGGILLRLRRQHCGANRLRIVAVHLINHVPAISTETGRRIVCKPTGHIAVDGYAVVIVKGDQLAEPEGSRQRA